MKVKLQHKPDYRVINFSLVDIPLTDENNSASVRKICALLEEGSKIVCVTARTVGKNSSHLEDLRNSLPGFVALLDHREYSDLSVTLAKTLSLGSDETDETILRSRWQSFSLVTQSSSLPFTLIVPNADSLSQSRLAQIRAFLRPFNGRLILTGCGDVAKLFDVTEADTNVTSSDDNAPPSTNRGVNPEPVHPPQLTVPITDNSVLPEPPTITDEILPDSRPAPEPETDVLRSPRRSKRKKKPLGWLTVGLGLGGVLGFLVASLPTPNGLVDLDAWFKGVTDRLVTKTADQPVQRSETAGAETPEKPSGNADSNVQQHKNDDAMVMVPEDAADDPQEKLSISPNNTAVVSDPIEPVAENPVAENPAADLAALEKTPITNQDPVVDTRVIAEPTALEDSAAVQPQDTPAADTESMQAPEPEPTPEMTLAPAERARLAATYLRRAQSEWAMGNLPQTLLEVARGLDADPDNKQLQELREKVLAEMGARTAQ